MKHLWPLLAEIETETDDGDEVFALITLGVYALIGLAFAIGIIWAFFSRRNREKRQEKFEDRDN